MEQNIDNSEANKLAKKGLEIIKHFLIESHKNDTKAMKEAEKTGDLYIRNSYINTNSQFKMFHTTNNLFNGLKYQKKQKKIRRERRRILRERRARIIAEEEIETTNETTSQTETESENTLTEFQANRDLKSLIEDVGSVALEGAQIGEQTDIRTNNFACQGAKVSSKDLKAKSFSSTSSRIITLSADLGLSSTNTKFQYVEWEKNPLDGHPQASSSITNTVDFSLYDEGAVKSLSVSDTKLPFYFFMKVLVPSDRHYCAYFNNKTQKYSDGGMKLVYKRLTPNGTGLIFCSANQLTEFAALKNAPAEHINILTKSNYDVLTKTGSFSNYNYRNSLGNIYIYIYITSL